MLVRRWPLLLGLFLSLGAVQAGMMSGNTPAEDWALAARWTARVGFPVFIVAYLASSLLRLAPSPLTKALVRNRRWWGLGFAASHTVHLVALVMALRLGEETRTIASLIPGGTTYVVIFAMALTSSDAAQRALGRNWKRLHTVGIHAIWLTFTAAYAGRIMEAKTRVQGVICTTIALTALAIRLTARFRGRTPVAA